LPVPSSFFFILSLLHSFLIEHAQLLSCLDWILHKTEWAEAAGPFSSGR
jgi:hypothetical protein